MKLSTITPLYNTLQTLSEKELPIRLSYKISKLLQSLSQDKEFYSEKFKNIVLKYAERDEKGEMIFVGEDVKIQPEFISSAEKELEELDEIEVTDIGVKFTLNELECLEMRPIDLQPLLPFIEE
jgi:hypothetical protein